MMLAEDVTVEMLLHCRLVTKAALKSKANIYDERRRLDTIAHARFLLCAPAGGL